MNKNEATMTFIANIDTLMCVINYGFIIGLKLLFIPYFNESFSIYKKTYNNLANHEF